LYCCRENKKEVAGSIEEAIETHIKGLQEDSMTIPNSHCDVTHVEGNIA